MTERDDFAEAIRREEHRKMIEGSAVAHTPDNKDWRISQVPSGKWVAWEETATVRDFLGAALVAGYVVTPASGGTALATSAWKERRADLDAPGSPGPLPVGRLTPPYGKDCPRGRLVPIDAICGPNGEVLFVRWAVEGQQSTRSAPTPAPGEIE